MEFAKTEVAAVQKAVEMMESDVVELRELELSLVGGGCGDVALG